MNEFSKRINPVFIGIFFVSMAILSLEVILTRIFSFSIWYHFAYLTISIALLGFGSSGAILAAYPEIIERAGNRLLITASLLSCFIIVAAFFTFSNHPLQMEDSLLKPTDFFASLVAHFLGVLLPFFFAGMAMSTALTMFSAKVSYIYFWDLFGAAIGSLLSLILINWLGAPGGVFVSAFILLVAACFFSLQTARRVTLSLALLAILFAGLIPYVKDMISIVPAETKVISRVYKSPEDYKLLFSKWNAINRVDIFVNLKERIEPYWAFHALSDHYDGTFPNFLDMQYDGANGSNIFQFKGDFESFRFLDYLLFKIPYLLLEQPKVLILGVGGGIDVFNALKNNSSSITAVELQPIAVQLLKGRFSEWVGDIYNKNDHINLIASEGRNFINRDNNKYDLIQITATDTFSALNTGAYVLMESYLYTKEACSIYFDHLTENGLLCIVVGDMINDPNDRRQPLNSRLMLQYLEVLNAKGIENPHQHLAVIIKENALFPPQTLPLLKKTPFTRQEILNLRSFSSKMGFSFIYDPMAENPPDNIMNAIISGTDKQRKGIIEELPYKISPCTDDNPFFFNFVKWKSVFKLQDAKKFYFASPVYGQILLLFLLILSVIFSLFFILLPLILSKKTKFKWNRSLGNLFYFFCLGVGFMFMEISFIQKFVLFLGYPAYAFAFTLFSLLLFSGIGSYWTSRIHNRPEAFLKKIIFILVPILLAYTLLLDSLFDHFIGQEFLTRVLITILMQMPLGFVLGMFFPIGIKLISEIDSRMVPWAWGVNAMTSVVSSIAAVVIAMSVGFKVVAYLAVAVYILGTSAVLITKRFGKG